MRDRREFLLKLASGVAYAAPAIRTLAAPASALAVGMASGAMMGMGMGMGMLIVAAPESPPSAVAAPWAKKPQG